MIDLVINQSEPFLSTSRSLSSGFTVYFGFHDFVIFSTLLYFTIFLETRFSFQDQNNF